MNLMMMIHVLLIVYFELHLIGIVLSIVFYFRFNCLRSLNLADNNLQLFPLSLCNITTLVELNLASNKLVEIPADIQLLQK